MGDEDSVEEKMGRRIRRGLHPVLEPFERRELLSAITDVMAASSLASHGGSDARGSGALASAVSDAGFVPSSTSVATADNQGPPPVGVNPALTPTGTLTRRQLRREQFKATFKGTYTIGPGRTSTEASAIFIAAAGTTNTMLHADIQVLIVTPKDPTASIGGISTIFDRNINSNTTLGLDLLAPQQNVDGGGRSDFFSNITPDVNISSGTYVDPYGQGVMRIHYFPSSKHTPGVTQQGTAIVTIHAQIYSAGTSFILHNANINP
jgi:hypothetical protein